MHNFISSQSGKNQIIKQFFSIFLIAFIIISSATCSLPAYAATAETKTTNESLKTGEKFTKYFGNENDAFAIYVYTKILNKNMCIAIKTYIAYNRIRKGVIPWHH